MHKGESLCCFRDSASVTYGCMLPSNLTLSALRFILSAKSGQSCKQDCETVDFCNSLHRLSLGVSSPLLTEWTVGYTEARSREIDDCDDMLEVVEVFDLPVLLTIEVKARIAHQLYESFILDDRRA